MQPLILSCLTFVLIGAVVAMLFFLPVWAMVLVLFAAVALTR